MNSELVKLREHRKAKGMTVRQLAAASGAATATISHIENKRFDRVNDRTLSKLTKGLGISVAEILWPPALAEAREEATAR